MKILIHIQIPEDGITLFRAYEDVVLPLLPNHNCILESRHISKSGTEEFHVIAFESQTDFENFKLDPIRIEAQPLWEQSDATAQIIELA